MPQSLRFTFTPHSLALPIIFLLLTLSPSQSTAGLFDDFKKQAEKMTTGLAEEALTTSPVDKPPAEKPSTEKAGEVSQAADQESTQPSAPPAHPAPVAQATKVKAASTPPTVKTKPAFSELSQLAKSAGQFAAHNDVCGNAIGKAVKTDFLSWAELFPKQKASSAINSFDQNYKFKKQQTRPYNCPDTIHRAALNKQYEYDLRVMGATSMPGGFTPSTSAEDVVAILDVAKTLPEKSLAPGTLPDMRAYAAQMTSMASTVSGFIGSAKECDDPVADTTRSQYLALIEPLPAAAKDKALLWGLGAEPPKQESKPGDRGYSPPRPCSRNTLESGRAAYEGTLKRLAEAARSEYRTKKAAPVTAANSKNLRIKRISVEDFYSGNPTDRVGAYTQAKLDAIIAECSGTREPMIRENIKTFLRATMASQASWSSRTAQQKEQMAERQMKKYDIQYEQTMAGIFNNGCEKVNIGREWVTPEQAYDHYLAFQAKLLEHSAEWQASQDCLDLEKAYFENAPGATKKAADDCKAAKYQQFTTAQQH